MVIYICKIWLFEIINVWAAKGIISQVRDRVFNNKITLKLHNGEF